MFKKLYFSAAVFCYLAIVFLVLVAYQTHFSDFFIQVRKKTYIFNSVKVIKDYDLLSPDCSIPRIDLIKFNKENLPSIFDDKKKIFFVETSGRTRFTARDACAIESAAKHSNLHVIVLMNAWTLNLMDHSTCKLYNQRQNISFYQIDFDHIFQDTPLQHFFVSRVWKQSRFKVDHLSDLLRFGLIYKHGGFYSDLDSVTLRGLSELHNVIGWWSTVIASGEFHMEKQHPVLWKCMQSVNSSYKGEDRIEIGPNLMTHMIMDHFNITKDLWTLDSVELRVLPTEAFYPYIDLDLYGLWEDQSDRFSRSFMVHFYGSQTKDLRVSDNPWNTAYAYLGVRFCPVAFNATDDF